MSAQHSHHEAAMMAMDDAYHSDPPDDAEFHLLTGVIHALLAIDESIRSIEETRSYANIEPSDIIDREP